MTGIPKSKKQLLTDERRYTQIKIFIILNICVYLRSSVDFKSFYLRVFAEKCFYL